MNDEEQIRIDTVLASYVNKIEIDEDGVYYDGKEYLSKDELVYLQDIEIIFEDYGLDKDRYEVFVAILRLAHEVRNIKYYLDVEKQSKSQEYEKFQSFIKGYGQILDIVGKEDIEIIKINCSDGAKINLEKAVIDGVVMPILKQFIENAEYKNSFSELKRIKEDMEGGKRVIQEMLFINAQYFKDVIGLRPMKTYRLLAEYLCEFGYRFSDENGFEYGQDEIFKDESGKLLSMLSDRVKSMVRNHESRLKMFQK